MKNRPREVFKKSCAIIQSTFLSYIVLRKVWFYLRTYLTLKRDPQDYNKISDKLDADIRDVGKKVQKFETRMEETMEKLQASSSKMEEAEKEFKDKDDDVNAQSRRLMLLEDECTINVEKLSSTVLKLAIMSKEADNIVKGSRHWESKTMNNEVEIEELDKNLREARRIGEY